jgi:hypothetical protein
MPTRYLIVSTCYIRGHLFEKESKLPFAVVPNGSFDWNPICFCPSKEAAEEVCTALNHEPPLPSSCAPRPRYEPTLQFRRKE